MVEFIKIGADVMVEVGVDVYFEPIGVEIVQLQMIKVYLYLEVEMVCYFG